MKKISFFLFFAFSITISLGQVIPKGKYIGYEQNPFCYRGNCIIIHDTLTKEVKSKLYFRVTINVTDSNIYVEKIPAYFYSTPDSLPAVDTASGGYYAYKAFIIQSQREMANKNLIGGDLIKCRYCPPSGGGTPRYVHLHYEYRMYGQNLFLNNEREFNMLFEKQ